MATAINFEVYSDALIVLGTAGVIAPMVRRWGVNPVLAYLGAGAALGPLGVGSFKDKAPFLHWVTITDAENVSNIAQLGVVFLFFTIGLELSYPRLFTMRRLVFGLGSLQVILSAGAIACLLALIGNSAAVSIMLGACLALSSTAIVLEILSSQHRLTSTTGRASFAVLLAQDLAVVPLLLFISMLGSGAPNSIWTGLLTVLGKAILFLGLAIAAGRLILRPFFHLVASSGAIEPFMAATLFVIIGTGVAGSLAGLPMSLGAFVAGLLLAETEFTKAIEAVIEPFKGLLLGLFFFTIGMSIDFRELAREPLWLFASVFGLIFIKSTLLTGLARLFHVPLRNAVETGLLLGPAGEFAFVGVGMAASLGIVSQTATSFTLAVTSLSMALIPLLAVVARRLSSRMKVVGARLHDPALLIAPDLLEGHAIVIGHGRVGEVVSRLLEHHRFPFLASDNDPALVSRHRKSSSRIYYGDATNVAFLKSCGLEKAAGVVVTTQSRDVTDEVVKVVRSLRPDIPIVARARDAGHARHLYAIGVTDAVPETIEASLQLSEAALAGFGLPSGPVIASIHDLRDEFRHELQRAAKKAGVPASRSIRKKTLAVKNPPH